MVLTKDSCEEITRESLLWHLNALVADLAIKSETYSLIEEEYESDMDLIDSFERVLFYFGETDPEIGKKTKVDKSPMQLKFDI